MLLHRWEAKIRRKLKSPQTGIELTTTRSWVRHAHHWATRAGRGCLSRFNSLPHNPHFQRPWKRRLLKILWEKEKMLVTSITSISSFSHYVSYSLNNKLSKFEQDLFCRLPVHQVLSRCTILSFGKELNDCPMIRDEKILVCDWSKRNVESWITLLMLWDEDNEKLIFVFY